MVLRWGILGSGKIARDFACSMLAVDGCEIVSVVSVRCIYMYTVYEAVVQAPQPVFVTLRSPPRFALLTPT